MPRTEIWAGTDIASSVWLAYSGITVAPFGGLFSDGLRVRVAGGYGQYSYLSKVWQQNVKQGNKTVTVSTYQEFSAQTQFADFLVGYLKRLGPLTAKAFVGYSEVGHEISPDDPWNLATDIEYGPKGVVELWLNIGEAAWGSLDLSATTAHDTRAARARLGYRIWPKLSLGVESGINVDEQGTCKLEEDEAKRCNFTFHNGQGDDQAVTVEASSLLDYARGGVFLRYEWVGGEASLAAGALGTSFDVGDDVEVEPYVTLNWISQF